MSSILTLRRWAVIVDRTGMLICRAVKAGGKGRYQEEHASRSGHALGAARVGSMVEIGSRLVRAVAGIVALSGLIVGCGVDLEQSPGPEKIVFAGDSYSIFVMNVDGTGVTRIADGDCPSFSRDGSKIVVGGYSISIMDPDGSNVTKLVGGGQYYPTFSPDGTRIAFAHDDAISVMNADGGELKQLIVVPDPTGRVSSIVIPGGAVIPLPFPVENTHGVASTGRPAFSPDGSKILFAEPSGVIWVMASDGTGARPLLADEPYVNSAPVFTADGAGIVYASNRARNGRTGIYMMDVDGQNIRLLTDDAAWPSFSPDGTKIIYTRYTGDPASTQGAEFQEIWVMNSDGSNPKRLTDPKQSVQHADWVSWGRGTDS